MVSGSKIPEPVKVIWSIDTKWFEKNQRSFFELAQHSMCPKCVEKLGKKKRKTAPSEVLAAINDCCGKLPGFVTARMPIMESVFRILLANGNRPMTVEDIGRELSERRGGDNYAGSPALLTRLLHNDHWYGFKQETESSDK